MSERKVLNKYFPPDFDPSKIPRRKLAKDQQHKVRLMTPFSMQCTICGEYVAKGKKFNARKERVLGEDYLGIQVFRFYIRCPRCSGEITFKTDPQKADYVAEHGAVRNFEPWRDDDDANEAHRALRAAAEENNPMKALENRTLDSKREMDILDALDEIRMRNARSERVDANGVLDGIIGQGIEERELARRTIEEHDDALAKAIFKNAVDGDLVRRIVDGDDDDDDEWDAAAADDAAAATLDKAVRIVKSRAPVLETAGDSFLAPTAPKRKAASGLDLGVVIKKKKPASASASASAAAAAAKPTPVTQRRPPPPPPAASKPSALAMLGAAYGDSDSDADDE
ncbi:hypothetical protein HDU87_001229 [Geranomyces variabilis]|uniref:Splicing factor YJU2 n=1 Tax=Geranomyces variabilis TaxID=109894 RepID=A0AAD5XJ33_9FUNG|nr:hypothetical protein HDU87_001229 [Geranomyces variabilis]